MYYQISLEKDIKLYMLDPFHLQRANMLSKTYLNQYSILISRDTLLKTDTKSEV